MDLFICTSPLQSLIASNIINAEKVAQYDVLYYVDNINSVHLNYLNNVSVAARDVVVMHDLMLKFPLNVIYLWRKFRGRDYNRIYISSIEATHFHYLLSIIKFNELITFDDGTANIVKSSLYYKDRNPGLVKAVFKMIGSRYSLERMKSDSSRHYTIYENQSNIVENPIYIPLVSHCVNLECSDFHSVDYVILGTVYNAVVKDESSVYFLKVKLKKYIDRLIFDKRKVIYIPHPKDCSVELDCFHQSPFFSIFDCNLIAEDFILAAARTTSVVVCGFGSSTQFNLMSANNVSNVFLSSNLLTHTVCDLYALSDTPKFDLDCFGSGDEIY
ncbi:glycosyltransferase family 52 [Aeromonas caviae]|uniref:glycosyltransferase family 52 n=1 Tax=Aeromonas caviae TaxID=648 RepID=UPI002B4A2370|nr:glycosyltransferase family 52 [Aeromonas caviae]